MNKPIINFSSYIIINAYKNASITSGYYIDIYLVRNEAKSNNSNPTSEIAYS